VKFKSRQENKKLKKKIENFEYIGGEVLDGLFKLFLLFRNYLGIILGIILEYSYNHLKIKNRKIRYVFL